MKAKPFLKCAGGKTKLLPVYRAIGIYPPPGFDKETGTYYEPFLGGGAMFFDLQPKKAVLTDLNQDLVMTYEAVKTSPTDIFDMLCGLKLNDDRMGEKAYYNARESFNRRHLHYVDQASLFIYLNKTCYRGLWRVNKDGKFNVPYGNYKSPKIVDEANIFAVSEALKNTVLEPAPFEVGITHAKEGDFVYLDPPYYPASKTANFTSYTAEGFTEEDHEILRYFFQELDHEGCYVMLSNSDTEFIRKLYKALPNVHVHAVGARSPINNKSRSELVITNYKGEK